jgi:hypothetical protein
LLKYLLPVSTLSKAFTSSERPASFEKVAGRAHLPRLPRRGFVFDAQHEHAGCRPSQEGLIESDPVSVLPERALRDEDNQRLLDGISPQNDHGRVLGSLTSPSLPPSAGTARLLLQAGLLPHPTQYIRIRCPQLDPLQLRAVVPGLPEAIQASYERRQKIMAEDQYAGILSVGG